LAIKGNSRKPLIFVIAAGLIIAGGLFLWNASLFGKALPKMDYDPALPAASQGTPGGPSTDPDTQAVSGESVPVCGGPAQMIVLILGIDENEQADAIRLARVNFVDQKVTVLSIPRDFYVPIPGFSEHDILQNRINAAYGFGEYFKTEGGGVTAVARTIYANWGITPDHYLVFHFENFGKVIDKIGGVDITLEKAVFGVGGNPYFGEGKHHLTGETALSFIRIRETDTDIQRIDRQTLVLTETLMKLRDTRNAAQLVELGMEMVSDKSILTDINFKNMYSVACLGTTMDSESVVFSSIPAELYTPFTTDLGANVRIPGLEVASFMQGVMYGADNQ
jgi:LCP family protein required for cell wall assembly